MLKKFAAAVIAVSLIAGPAFAQGVLQTTPKAPATTGQPAAKVDTKADAKIAPKTVATTGVKVKETGTLTTRKHVSLRHRHHVRHFAHVKHVKHAVHAKHLKQVKRINAPAKAKISG